MLNATQHGASLQLFETATESWTNSRCEKRSRSIHKLATDRIALELAAREGLICRFHAGVALGPVEPLLPKGLRVVVQSERGIQIGSHRYVPDLTIRCPKTWKILLLIEVWDSHPVSAMKARALGVAQIPWIEVKARHALARLRRFPLTVLDWGGPGLPNPPHQGKISAALN